MIKRILFFTLAGLLVLSCAKEKPVNMTVKGEIKNLKKGTLYLQKVKDTVLIAVDSVKLDGSSVFSLSDFVESPEIYYLSLDKKAAKQISFFGEAGETTITTKLDRFQGSAVINGQSNQQLLEEYNTMIGQFSDKRLDLIKADFEAKKSGDSLFIDSIQGQIESLLKRRYYYTTNFAVTHADKEVAAYLALSELFDANVSLLDTINNSITPGIKEGKYGKALEKFIADIKKKE